MDASHRLCLLAMLGGIACGVSDLSAQDPRDRTADNDLSDLIPFAPFLSPSRFWILWPSTAYYEGDVAFPMHLWSRTDAIANVASTDTILRQCLGGRVQPLRTGDPSVRLVGTGCTFTLVPHFVIRQLSSNSAPVRTPTFNPYMEFNWHVIGYSRPTQRAVLQTIHVRLAHYSNGQAGCLLTNQDPTRNCAKNTAIGDTLNRVDGSFSTHYLEAGISRAWLRFDSRGTERITFPRFSAAARWYPPGLENAGGMDNDLADIYGRWTIAVSNGYRVRQPRLGFLNFRTVSGIHVDAERAFGRPYQYKRWRGTAESYVAIPALYGAGVALRYAWGWDYYNIGFGADPPGGKWAFGLRFDHTQPITVTPAAAAAARAAK